MTTPTLTNRATVTTANATEEERLQHFAGLRDSSDPLDAEQAMRISEELIERYMPLVGAAVRKWRAKMPRGLHSIGFEDLRAAGTAGLWKALLAFDPGRCPSFIRYANRYIYGEMGTEIRRAGFVKDNMRRELQRTYRVVSSLENRLGREATEEEAATASGVSVQRYRDLCLWDRRSITSELTEPVLNYLSGSDDDPLNSLCAVEEALEALAEDSGGDPEIAYSVREIGEAVENVKDYFDMEGAA